MVFFVFFFIRRAICKTMDLSVQFYHSFRVYIFSAYQRECTCVDTHVVISLENNAISLTHFFASYIRP